MLWLNCLNGVEIFFSLFGLAKVREHCDVGEIVLYIVSMEAPLIWRLSDMTTLLSLSREKYKSAYKLSDYTINGLIEIQKDVDFTEKSVLELGGWNIPSTLTLEGLGSRSWTCVDMIDSISGAYQKRRFSYLADVQVLDIKQSEVYFKSELAGHYVFDGDATNLPDWFHQRFDIVISFATLEHVLDVPRFFQNVLNSLKPGGVFVTRFGPLWNCYNGHHAWVSTDLNFNNVGYIDDWGHLLNTPPQMYTKLINLGFSADIAATAVFQIYTSPRINRYFSEDYLKFANLAGFGFVHSISTWKKPPAAEVQARLNCLFPNYRDFETCALYLKCLK